jgi:hypothetical protein
VIEVAGIIASSVKGNAKKNTNIENRSVKIGEAGSGTNVCKEPIRSAKSASGIADARGNLSNAITRPRSIERGFLSEMQMMVFGAGLRRCSSNQQQS